MNAKISFPLFLFAAIWLLALPEAPADDSRAPVKPLRERLQEARNKALYPMEKVRPGGGLSADGMDYSRFEEGVGPGQWRDW